jgi:hypothetical protein
LIACRSSVCFYKPVGIVFPNFIDSIAHSASPIFAGVRRPPSLAAPSFPFVPVDVVYIGEIPVSSSFFWAWSRVVSWPEGREPCTPVSLAHAGHVCRRAGLLLRRGAVPHWPRSNLGRWFRIGRVRFTRTPSGSVLLKRPRGLLFFCPQSLQPI